MKILLDALDMEMNKTEPLFLSSQFRDEEPHEYKISTMKYCY